MNRLIAGGITPHFVPLPVGEGTLLHALELFRRPFSPPHSLANAVLPSCKLALASLREKDRMRGDAAGCVAHWQVEGI